MSKALFAILSFHSKTYVILVFLFLFISYTAFNQQDDSLSQALDTSQYDPNDYNFNLIIASELGYPTEVLRLLKKGAEVNSRTIDGVTPLMYAAANEYENICRILLLNGADPNLTPNIGIGALITAVKTGNRNIVELLLRNGADVNNTDENGISSLMYTAAFNLPLLADMLIYYEANVNQVDNTGNTALLVASYYGNTEIVKLLAENKATLEKCDAMGYTPMHCAAQNNNIEIVKFLIDLGCSYELKNNAGYSVLSIAVLNNNSKLVEYLIGKSADVNSAISMALYPLNLARDNKSDTIINLLLSKNAMLSRKPLVNYGSLNFDFSFTQSDFMMGGGIGFHDSRYGLSLNTGYVSRIIAKSIIESEPGNVYYQYWERRSYVYLGLLERIKLYSWQESHKIGMTLGGQVLYPFASYRGVSASPNTNFMFSPQASLYVQLNNFVLSLRYEYIDFNITDVSPNHFNIGLQFLIPGKRVKQSAKKVLWYL